MPRWTSRAPKEKTPVIAPSGPASQKGGQTQTVRTIRRALFPREFFKGVRLLTNGMGVLELSGAQRGREFNRCAGCSSGATARGVGHAKASSFGL
jgi:hypothetical protein